MNIRGDKRGSHVSVVISFAIFVTFVIFLYTLAQPSIRNDIKEDAILVYLENQLIENSSSYLTTMTVNIETSSGSNCIQLDNFISNFGIDNRVSTWNQEQVSTESAVSGNNLRINRLNSGDEFFKIYYSESFNYIGTGSGWTCQSMSEGSDYTLGVTKKEKYVFERQIMELIEDYNIWYDPFKEEMGVPRNFEFGSIFETETPNISKSIYVKEVPIQYVTKQGEIKNGFFRLKTW
jgi:hypothetical protein